MHASDLMDDFFSELIETARCAVPSTSTGLAIAVHRSAHPRSEPRLLFSVADGPGAKRHDFIG